MIGNISGNCFTRAGVSFISSQQERHLERTGIGKECDLGQSVGSYHRTILQKKERPLQLAYSDYLKSVLSQLRQIPNRLPETSRKCSSKRNRGEIFSQKIPVTANTIALLRSQITQLPVCQKKRSTNRCCQFQLNFLCSI